MGGHGREKSWATHREQILWRAQNDPSFDLNAFLQQRMQTAYTSWREARRAERERNFTKARGLYLQAVESCEQAQKVTEDPDHTDFLNGLNAEYTHFVVDRDPNYRRLLYALLPCIADHPWIAQTELYSFFPDIQRSDISYALYFAEREELIAREKKGRSYQLLFVRQKGNAPLLTIEDDEIDAREKTEKAKAGCGGCGCVFPLAVLSMSGLWWLLA